MYLTDLFLTEKANLKHFDLIFENNFIDKG